MPGPTQAEWTSLERNVSTCSLTSGRIKMCIKDSKYCSKYVINIGQCDQRDESHWRHALESKHCNRGKHLARLKRVVNTMNIRVIMILNKLIILQIHYKPQLYNYVIISGIMDMRLQLTRGQSNLTKSANSPVRGHPRGLKFVPLNSWGRVSY